MTAAPPVEALEADIADARTRLWTLLRRRDQLTPRPPQRTILEIIDGHLDAACLCGHQRRDHAHEWVAGEWRDTQCTECPCPAFRAAPAPAARREPALAGVGRG